jgi:IS30 family transposase
MGYRRFTAEERRLIYQLLKAKRSRGEIGRLLDRSKGAISREIKRNTEQYGYRPKQAHERAEARARTCGRHLPRSKRKLSCSPELYCGNSFK